MWLLNRFNRFQSLKFDKCSFEIRAFMQTKGQTNRQTDVNSYIDSAVNAN